MNNFEQARRFLASAIAWPQGGEAAFCNIHWSYKVEGKDKLFWGGRACADLNEAVNAVQWASSRPDTQGVYVCMSTQNQYETKTTAKGYQIKIAKRLQENAVELKSLWIDIDFKGGAHGYDTPVEAVHALQSFLTATGLPKPSMMVQTGGGLHVHWLLASALTPDQWRPLAYALAEATKRENLKCDSQCTIDSARVLRVPDTSNNKYGAPRPVKIGGTPLDFGYMVPRIEQSLEKYKVAVPKQVSAPALVENPTDFLQGPSAVFAQEPADNAMVANVEQRKGAPIVLDETAKECPFLADTLATGGQNHSQPLWNLAVLVSTFTDGGRSDAHRMSDKHPGYSSASTDELFTRKERERQTHNLGYPSCSAISGTGCTLCQSCPHFGKGKSPLNFKPAPPAPSQQPVAQLLPTQVIQTDLPSGYARRADGVIGTIVVKDDGTQDLKPLCEWAMEDAWLQSGDGSSILNFATRIRGKPRPVVLALNEIGTHDMRKVLQAQDIMPPMGGKSTENLGNFFVAWIKKLQETKDMVNSADFGWTVANGKEKGFVYGGSQWTPTGETKAPSGDSMLARTYSPTGDIQKWKDAFKLVAGRPDLEAIVASSFAAPLVRFTGHNGMTLSTFSLESGAGKSTATNIAQAVWGAPKGVSMLNDTYNFTMGKLGRLKALPLYWDELKSDEQWRKFLDVTFDMTLGREKGRQRRDASLRGSGEWQTLLVVSSNASLLDYVSNNANMSEAGIVRIFEINVQKAAQNAPGMIDSTKATRIAAALNDNYGHVGLEYAKWLGANHAAIKQDIGDLSEELSAEVKMKQDERFWIALMAVLIKGAEYATALGFASFDVPGLRKYLIDTLQKMRIRRKDANVDMADDMNVSNVFARFWSAQSGRHVLWTDTMRLAPGKPTPGSIKVTKDASKLDGVHIQVAENLRIMRIAISAIHEWCERTKTPRFQFVRSLQAKYSARKLMAILGAGTIHKVPNQYVLEIDLNMCPNLDFLQ